jgi:hypothetical protein
VPTKVLKSIAVVALVIGILWPYPTDYRIVLQFLICTTAVVVMYQASRDGRYSWAAAFFGIALLFNPLFPIAFSRDAFLWLDVASVTMIAVSFVLAHTLPRLTIPSVTNPARGSESL